MNEIICPHCKKAFKVDKAGYADILKQVRDHEFNTELHDRMVLLERDKQNAVELATEKTRNELTTDIAKRDAEIAELKARATAKIKELETENDLTATKLAAQKNAELAELKARLQAVETEKQLAITEAVVKVEKQRDQLAGELKSKDAEKQLLESSLKDKYETQLRDREDTIERLKDMKAKLSVKLVGENLEQHCQNEFNSVRMGQFPYAYFDKDNEAVRDDGEAKGTKGDFVYRDYDAPGGTEIISIMFEMKDEQDVSANKRTVESHLEKLDKDRKKKGLEYAVLVTLLEAESELYNRGIVDMSYKFEKMYVIRPQFFVPFITLLKNANIKSLDAKRELALVRDQHIDITNFEHDLQSFQNDFMTNVKNSSNKFQEAMDGINTTIKKLENVKEALRLSNKHLLTAGNKVENVSLKRLTKENPTMATKFSELK